MKKLALALAAFVLTTSLFAQKKADDVAKFKTDVIEMGKLKQDNPTTAVFEITNISKEPLIIEQANPTCGCTIGDYTKEPIAPGKTGYIKATYNAKNLNIFEKHLTVKFAGVDEVKSITIKGEVLTADDYAKLPQAVEVRSEKVKPVSLEQRLINEKKEKAKKEATQKKP